MGRRIVIFIAFICVFALGCTVTYLYCDTKYAQEQAAEPEPVAEPEPEPAGIKVSIDVGDRQDELVIPEIPDDCIGYLSIPSCGISGFIRYGSTMESISNGHVGEFEDTGEIGVDNYCILGHAREGKDSLVFTDLEPNISTGDLIYVVKDSRLYTFQTGYYRVIEPEDVWILDRTGYPGITIMCCTNQGKQRFVVFGGLVGSRSLLSKTELMEIELEKLSESMSSDESETLRKSKADIVFGSCAERGLIEAYEYDPVSKLYTFRYDDGSFGGFRISDSDDAVN